MNVTFDASIIALILTVMNIIGASFALARIQRDKNERFAGLELKTNTMWKILVEETLSEAQRSGVLKRSSPLRVERKVAEAFGTLGSEIRDYYTKKDLSRLSDNEALLIIANRYADELLSSVCAKLNINLRTALVAALLLCKEGGN